ncbi:TIGR04139 family peptide modification target [Chryseobacterium gotjawalense]|uniref:TIGR04139 family peptide modification target n=1 Tax=Chryseobacterium gotjawalense TaxID=3042315 RepID=A0ABY8RD90_9FLAO|nr:TIGR04139 family peptide modification target [Chryseobacterium sp. wdc7]WHF51925.1 TIGR04139 family peptide modification target [Chryseobacterium sp. wdc7]
MKKLTGMKKFSSLENKKLEDLNSVKGGMVAGSRFNVSSGEMGANTSEARVFDDDGNFLFSFYLTTG